MPSSLPFTFSTFCFGAQWHIGGLSNLALDVCRLGIFFFFFIHKNSGGLLGFVFSVVVSEGLLFDTLLLDKFLFYFLNYTPFVQAFVCLPL